MSERSDGLVPWPDADAERYVAAGHWRGKPLGHWMWTWAQRYGTRTAIVDGDRRISYLELARHADALAGELLTRGIGDGDAILVQLPNCWEFVALFFACQRIGVVPVLALMPHRERELEYLAELADVKAIVVVDRWRGFDHQRLAANLRGTDRQVLVVGDSVRRGHLALRPMLTLRPGADALRARLDAQAPDSRRMALLLLSGGTTGLAKLVPRTHDDYEYNARRSAEVCGFDASTVYLVALPAAHNFPLGSPGILGTLMNGGRVVMVGSPRPEVAFEVVERERVTVTSLVPTIVQRWVEAAATAPHDLCCLRMVQVGGSVLSPALAERIGPALGCGLQQVYGMAEGLLNYTRPGDDAEVVTRTQGRPISPDDEIRIEPAGPGEADRTGKTGTVGELLTRGPYTIRGYFAAPEHNAVAFTPDGWYRTGDIVRRLPTGDLVVEGRIKDIINRGGEKIAAAEIEAVVRTLPQVRQAGAINLPDAEFGEQICACVSVHSGTFLTLHELREAFHEQGVAKFKVPQRLEIFAELPFTPIGKIDKKKLRSLVDHRHPNRDAPESAKAS